MASSFNKKYLRDKSAKSKKEELNEFIGEIHETVLVKPIEKEPLPELEPTPKKSPKKPVKRRATTNLKKKMVCY